MANKNISGNRDFDKTQGQQKDQHSGQQGMNKPMGQGQQQQGNAGSGIGKDKDRNLEQGQSFRDQDDRVSGSGQGQGSGGVGKDRSATQSDKSGRVQRDDSEDQDLAS